MRDALRKHALTLETKIIAAAGRSRFAFEAVKTAGVADTFNVLNVPVWLAVSDYYERDSEATHVDVDVVVENVARGGDGDKKAGALRRMAKEALTTDVSPANIVALLRDQAKDTAGMRLASAIAGRKEPGEIDRLARSYVTLLDSPADEPEEALTWGTVLRKRLDPTQRIKLSPPCLNERVKGGVFPGTFIVVIGRPEDGKSALALTMACGFMRRGLRGLYLCNEDPISSMMTRAVSNLTMLTEEEMTADPAEAERLAIARGAGNGVFRDLVPSTPGAIEALVKRYKPSWLVVDQIRNIRIKDAGGAEGLDQAAQAVRNIAKKYGLVTIGVHQAGDSASGKLVVGMSDSDGSKTGIPGACDLFLGIGANDNLRSVGQRMFNLAKNKVSAVHEYWAVTLDSFHSKYVSIK